VTDLRVGFLFIIAQYYVWLIRPLWVWSARAIYPYTIYLYIYTWCIYGLYIYGVLRWCIYGVSTVHIYIWCIYGPCIYGVSTLVYIWCIYGPYIYLVYLRWCIYGVSTVFLAGNEITEYTVIYVAYITVLANPNHEWGFHTKDLLSWVSTHLVSCRQAGLTGLQARSAAAWNKPQAFRWPHLVTFSPSYVTFTVVCPRQNVYSCLCIWMFFPFLRSFGSTLVPGANTL